MVPQLTALLRPRLRARSRSRFFVSPMCAAIEMLEERTLLSSATLAILNGNFSGTYSGRVTVNNNGTKTTSNVSSTAFTMTVNNGAINFTSPVGTGTGTVDNSRNIVGTLDAPFQGDTVPISVSGKMTNVNANQTFGTGTWTFSVNLGGGVTASGSGNWSAGAPQILSDFNGIYAGSYQGAVTVNDHGTKTVTPVNPNNVTAVINNGVISVALPSSNGLTLQSATIDVTGRVKGAATFVQNGVTITVTFTGPASRGQQGVNGIGTWNIKTTTIASGVTISGSGTYSLESVLDLDGVYAGTATGNVTENDNGTITNIPIPGSAVTDNSINIQIFGGIVTVFINDVSGTGKGNADDSGNITGLASIVENQTPVTIVFSGTGAPTASGNVLNGTWSIPTTNIGGGVTNVTISGSGTWTATQTDV
jgi:hypothetical protein